MLICSHVTRPASVSKMEVIPCTVITFLCVINIIYAVEIINVENERAKGKFENISFYIGKKKLSYY